LPDTIHGVGDPKGERYTSLLQGS
jgi:hypothetical protein